MRLIDADKLLYNDIDCVDGHTYMVVHTPEIDNAPTVFDLESANKQLDEMKKQAEKDMNYHSDNSSNYPCEYNMADLKEREYKILCNILEILKSATNEKGKG